MRYPLPLLLLSDFMFRPDLIHNLLYFRNFHLPNYIAMSFHTLVLDPLHLHFMLFYYTHFRLHLLLLRLVLYDLYSLLHYLYNSSYFMLYHLSLHYMFRYFHLLYNFILLFGFMLRYLYYLPMSLLLFMSYNYSMLDYMSMFHMLVPLYRMYMSLFLVLYFTHHLQMLLYMSHFILHYLVALHLFHYYSMSHFMLYM